MDATGKAGATGSQVGGSVPHESGRAGGAGDGGLRSGVVLLEEYGLLKVHGADAAGFLQSQLTNDVAALEDGQVCLAGYCSVKGRLMASFWVWRETAAQTFWLACSRDIAAATAKRLSMFVLRAKAKVEDVSQSHALLGFLQVGGGTSAPRPAAWPADAVALAAVGISARLAAALDPARLETAADQQIARALKAVPVASVDESLQALALAGLERLPMSVWRRLEVLSGVARIEAGNQELFVPQMINFELVGGVNFRKGCYPGQEVVARSQYLGKLKRRMFLGLGSGSAPASGSDVHAPASGSAEPVGQVVLAAPMDDDRRFVMLFESTLDAVPPETDAPQDGAADDAASGPALKVGDSPVARLPLPYPLPPPQAAARPASRAPDAGA